MTGIKGKVVSGAAVVSLAFIGQSARADDHFNRALIERGAAQDGRGDTHDIRASSTSMDPMSSRPSVSLRDGSGRSMSLHDLRVDRSPSDRPSVQGSDLRQQLSGGAVRLPIKSEVTIKLSNLHDGDSVSLPAAQQAAEGKPADLRSQLTQAPKLPFKSEIAIKISDLHDGEDAAASPVAGSARSSVKSPSSKLPANLPIKIEFKMRMSEHSDGSGETDDL